MTKNRDEIIAIYDRLIAAFPTLKRKGKATAYTAINGNMFTFVDAGGMNLRISKEDIVEYGRAYSADPVVRHNRVMNGYIAVSNELLSDEVELKQWFARAVTFAETLKSKPVKKKK